MKKSFFAVIPALLFASCSFWNEPVEEFFSYWGSEAYVTDSSVKVPKQNDSEGIISVASDKNAEVILNIANPKNFNLVMPSAGNTEMIHFNAFDPQPVFGVDYMIEKLSSKELKLTYTAQFLKKHEWGQKDLGASITMFADDGREFKKNYTFKIKSNTKPPQPSVILAQTNESTPHYVLCLTVPDMDTQVNGKKLHKDIAQIVINESSYELKINDSGSDFVKPTDESFIIRTDVAQLTTHGAEAVPTGNWTLFYKTDRQVGGAYKEYTVTLKDQRGLSSEKLETGTTINKPAEETVTLNAGTQESGSGTNALPFIIQAAGTKPEAQLIISCTSSGTTVHCTVTDVSTGISSEYNGNPANVPLGLNGENEKLYEVKYNTKGYGYNPTTLKTKYYKILKLHTVTFNANGGKFADDSTAKTESVLHGRTVTAPSASPTRVGNVFIGWYKEEDGTTEWNFTDDTIRSNTIIYAKWSDKAVEIKSDEDGAWKKLKEEAAKTSGVSVIVIDGEIKATTDSGNSGEITIGRNLTIQGKTGATTDKLNANGNVLGHSNSHRIFKVTGGKTLTLKNLTLKGGRAEKSDSSSPLNASGGSILLESGTVSLSHVTVFDCKAITTAGNSGQGGGIYVKSGTLTINNSMLSANEASKSGGAIYADTGTTVKLDICTIQNCKASDGGAIYNDMGTLTIKGASTIKNNEATNNGGAFLIKGGSPNGSLHMENNCIVEQNKAKKGGGIYITDSGTAKILFCRVSQNEAQDDGGSVYVDNGTFTIGGSTLITPSTAGETNQKGKNDVYLANGQKITIDDTLTGTHPVARITPATYNKTTQVLGGTPALLGSEHTKFTVTQKDNEKWGVSEQGKLALMEAAIDADASPADAWKKFKEAVKAAGDGAVITVKGEIKATNATDNSGEIVIDNNLTVKKADGATSAVLNANKDGANAPATTHRIFKVASGKTLTLENLTIKGGKPDGSDEGGNGGGILLQGGALNMKNCDVKGNEAAGAGGGIYIDTGCSLTMKDNAKVTGNESSTSGGGIHAENGSTLVIEHCSVTANTASGSGGGIHAGGALTVDSCAITDNKTTGDSGGGAYVSGTAEIKGSTTIAHNEADVSGGGIYMGSGSLHIKNSTIGGEQDYEGTDLTKTKGNKAKSGGGIFVSNGTLNMEDSTLSFNKTNGGSNDGGGGIAASNGTFTIKGCTFKNNDSGSGAGGGIKADNITLTMTDCTLTNNNAGGGGGGILTSGSSSLTMETCTLTHNEANFNGGGGVYASGSAFTMTDCTLTGNVANNNGGGGVYVAEGTFTMKGSSRITPSSVPEENAMGKNEVFLKNNKMITVPDALTGTHPVARITPATYNTTTQVLTGSKVGTEHSKFTVTPKTVSGGTQVWTIKNDGYLQKPPITIKGSDSLAWKKLKEAIAAADDGDIFIINGEVKATNATDNSGELEVNKDITVKKALSASTAVLNANSRHSGTAPADAPATKHRIFKVTSGKTLTLQNLTLKGGIAETSGDALGGGISVINGGKVTLKNTAIRDCQAQYGGAVNVKGSSSSVTMESGSLTANTATTIGGAVNVDNGASFTMTGGEITGNTGKSGGGGAYVHEGTFTLGTGALITSNTAEGRNGGGVYVDSGGTLTINGGAIKSNKATKSGSAVGNGGGVYVFGNTVSKGKVRMTAGEISGNAAGLDGTAYIGDGGGVYNEGGTVEISGGEVKGNNANYGGGVYAKDGTVNITGGVIGGANAADANKATGTSSGEGMGGGIYVSNCTVTLKDGVQVIGNTAKYGGGVYASGGSLVITSSTIGKCQATQEGGGIFAKGGSVELNSCTIKGNTGTLAGGGICARANGSTPARVTINGGVIGGTSASEANKTGSSGKGGGIFVSGANSEVTLLGTANVIGNTAKLYGGGVFVDTGSVLNMQGSAIVTPSTGSDANAPLKNDVYLMDGCTIKLSETLSGAVPVARITPAAYNTTTKVLTGGAVGTEHGKFTVTPKDLGSGNTQQWEINSTGFLQKTPVVIDGSGDAWKKLKDAVAAANDGDVIIIDGEVKATNTGSGTNANFGAIDITKNITIEKADGAASAVLNANRSNLSTNAHPIFRVSGGKTLTLKNLTLKGGKGISGTFGGAINVTGSSKAELTDCVIEDCTADNGGAIGCGNGTIVNLTDTIIQNCKGLTPNNAAGIGGGVYAAGATVNITNCTFTGNKAKSGGAVCGVMGSTASTVTISGGTIGGTGTDANKATGTGTNEGKGGAIFVGEGCTLNMQAPTGSPTQGVQLIGNSAGKEGGGVYAHGATVNITNCTLKGNEAKSGGAVYAEKAGSTAPSTVTISGGTIGGTGEGEANKATGNGTGSDGGGGIYVGETCTLTMQNSAQVIGNTATFNGAGIYTKGTLIMESCTITDNKTIGANNNTGGGGVYVESGSVEIKDATKIYHNYTDASGGGIYVNDGTVTLKDATIGGEQLYDGTDSGKTKGNKAQYCGGIYVKNGSINMENCTLSSNTARNGGGIQADNGNLTVKDCILTNNEADFCGGGIYVKSGTVTLNNTTIGGEQLYDGTDSGKTKGNKAKSGGGVYIEGNGTSVTMNGGSIQYNKTIDGDGGGVYIKGDGTSFTMNGGKITQCKADVTSPSSSAGRGGGIYIYGDNASSPINITIKGTAEISHNESTCQGTRSGGGIYGGTNSIITVSENATIKNNSAKGFGGGVYFQNTFIFMGGTITENTASRGAGIFSENSSTKLEMSGNARVTNDNDIDLPGGRVVTITGGALTGTAPVARITVPDNKYLTSTQVLAAGAGVTLANETYKFAVTPKIEGGTPQPWTVGGSGFLKQGRYTEVPYGQLETYLANNASSTEVNYIEVTGISAADLKGSFASNSANPGPLGEKIKAADPKKVALKLPDGLSYVTSMRGCFAECRNLISVENIPSNVTDMCCCFYYCESLITAPVIPSSVTDMTYCFRNCTALTTVPNIPATVKSMAYCFNGCKSLTQCPDIPSSVTNMIYCFRNCTSLQSVKIKCNYSSNKFNNAFKGCTALEDNGIKVPSGQLTNYQNAASAMGTTEDKFSAF